MTKGRDSMNNTVMNTQGYGPLLEVKAVWGSQGLYGVLRECLAGARPQVMRRVDVEQ
jgi:hypothetical protein